MTEPQQPPIVPTKEQLDPEALELQMRWATYQAAVRMAAATDPREIQECASAILQTAQATVILDPALVAPQGVPPDALSPPRPRIPMDKSAPSGKHAAGG